MIQQHDLFPIGYAQKPHGIHGEIAIRLTHEIDDLEYSYFVFEMDGIFVPFFMEEWRLKNGNTALLKLSGIDTGDKAQPFAGKTVYLPKSSINFRSEPVPMPYTGYTMIDKKAGKIGIIDDLDDSTENLLFIINRNNSVILIPAAGEFILSIDESHKIIHTDLPDGLVNLNESIL